MGTDLKSVPVHALAHAFPRWGRFETCPYPKGFYPFTAPKVRPEICPCPQTFYPFTAPKVRPETRYLEVKRKSITTGMEISTAAAEKGPQLV